MKKLFNKRFLATAITVTLCAASFAANKKGDVNGDGSITPTDAEWVAQYILGEKTLTSTQKTAANCDGETGIDIGDVMWILNNLDQATIEIGEGEGPHVAEARERDEE